MEKLNKVFDNELDKDWLQLIYEARQLGLSSKEIKDFLRQNKAQ
ncbi:DNA-binding anti-repressor SinI [Priestia megaterium]|nr:DNA-binding anti-repressor SinI [Priestia megaterium]MBZ5479317.1 anti-repressor SinI family protein [Bacillus sp. T_4]MCA4155881.1 anti-repressor SinI family protein [Priestia megaterium]MCR8865019.1 anti-repressor SinI family protein [Priestia megaterium]MDN3228424.1 DNA-binding anti-repressor SinI [Priestia megaterium]NGY72434.1 DNA-binding anti-repressor SinI [Priestia megaterium]